MTQRTVDLGLPCPACGSRMGYHPTESWNCWTCKECTVISTIRDGNMEIVPLRTAGRTEADEIVDAQARDKEADWAKSNRAFCGWLHRGVIDESLKETT